MADTTLVRQARGSRPGSAPRRHRARSRRPSPLHLILVPLAAVMLVPLAWMLLLSISTQEETRRFPPGLPGGVRWQNYIDAWTEGQFGHWLLNSTIATNSR